MTERLLTILTEIHGPIAGPVLYDELQEMIEGQAPEIGFPGGPPALTDAEYDELTKTIPGHPMWAKEQLRMRVPLDRIERWKVIEDAVRRGLIVVREPDGCVATVTDVTAEAKLPGIVVLEPERRAAPSPATELDTPGTPPYPTVFLSDELLSAIMGADRTREFERTITIRYSRTTNGVHEEVVNDTTRLLHEGE